MISARDFERVSEWIDRVEHPLIFSHVRPDGDALGSMIGMALMLQANGKSPTMVLYDQFPGRYSLLRDMQRWSVWEEESAKLLPSADGFILVDTCSFAQLEPITQHLQDGPPILVMDHHATRDPIGTRPGDWRVVDPTAASASVIITEWGKHAELLCSPDIATALFTGVATDTGWFRFSNTDARTLRVAGDLVDAGARLNEIYDEIYQRERPEKLRLIARMLNSLQLHADGRLAVMRLTYRDFLETGADSSMTEDLVNEPGRLGTVESTILFTEQIDGVIRANFRSKRRVDVSELASRFGGGGHVRASGARIKGGWSDIERVIAEAISSVEKACGTPSPA